MVLTNTSDLKIAVNALQAGKSVTRSSKEWAIGHRNLQ